MVARWLYIIEKCHDRNEIGMMVLQEMKWNRHCPSEQICDIKGTTSEQIKKMN